MKKLYFSLLLFIISFYTQAQENADNLVKGTTRITKTETIQGNKNVELNLSTTESSSMSVAAAPTGNSTEVGTTPGELSVSNSGTANYNIPISVPSGINGVVPKVGLFYSSQGGNGSAGYGWNISGISSITRIPSTKFHDGTIDPVDFNSLDRFALDGQRLVIKTGTTGTYGADNVVYETEEFSNVKITSIGVHPAGANYGPAYFKVEYPDGSKAFYGVSGASRSVTDWAITYWENPQGVRITYSYSQVNNIINISSIKYGTIGSTTPINEIQFLYKARQRQEDVYIGAQRLIRSTILSQIITYGNNVSFSKYVLNHETTSLGYERLTSITQTSGDGTKSYNPTVFTYDTTEESIVGSPISIATNLSVGNITGSNAATVSGDFNGDGGMDFILYPTTGTDAKKKYWIFSDVNSSSLDIGWQHDIGTFDEIFAVNYVNFNNKLMPLQGWTAVRGNSFTTYALAAYGIIQQDQKVYTFPRFVLNYFYQCGDVPPMELNSLDKSRPPLTPNPNNPIEVNYERDIPRSFVSGDFNGDGITDVIAIEKSFTYPYHSGCNTYTSTYYGGRAFFINLDQRIPTDFTNAAGYLSVTNTSKFLVADFNGDGKSDLYVFDTGIVKIYKLDDNKQFVMLHQTSPADPNIAIDKPILMGDYNGDGKSDFIIPKATGSSEWYKYSSNGVNLVKETKTYFNFPANTSTSTYNIIPTDYNNDGKTDILVAGSFRVFNTGGLGIKCYINKGVGLFSDTAGNFYNGNITNQELGQNALPIFLSSSQPNRKLELAYIFNNKIYTFNSTKDFSKEQLLRTIIKGNGVTESISYKPLSPSSTQDFGSIYSNSGYTENYPNIDIISAPSFEVVTKLEKISATVYKKQLFSYYGAVSNVEGLGFLGFRATSRTNWFDDSNPITSNVSKNDMSLRGANVENYTVLGFVSASGSSPSNYINKTAITYSSQLLPNKVFKLQGASALQYNSLENINSETISTYDSYSNPTQTILKVKEGSTLIQTNTAVFEYDNQPTGTNYYIGRPTKKTQTVVVSGDTSTSEEIYAYTNQLLTQVKKKGTGTDYLIEDNIYDAYGNITQKSISATGVVPRVTKYTYDTSGRFLTKSTDIENLSTIYDYNLNNGTLNFTINPYGIKTTYNYNSWFQKIKTTDYLGKTNNYVYSVSSYKSVLTTTGDDGSASEEIYDDLGRKIKTGVKNINGVFSYISYNYDIFDRNIQISEPYFGTSPTQWNISSFDSYGRLSTSSSHTGNLVSFTYSGLSTTVSKNGKTKTTTKNAVGNIISLTETPGGTINYTYFADGNLKSSSFDGIVTTIEQDGWGRKTKLIDPSAGVYLYEYNIFGEITKETTPNGSTTYTLNNEGKVIEKLISGNLTNSKTTYTYDSTSKLLTNTKFENLLEGTSTIINTLTYDTSKRIIRSVETTPFASFTKDLTYDAFGRINKTTSTATTSGKSSSRAVRNIYKNGAAWQILDDSNSAVLWQTNVVNARGQLTSGQSGPIAITNTFDSYGFPSQIKYDKSTVPATNILTLTTVFDALKGNLTSRSNNLLSWNESFKYDTLDRLTEFTNTLGAQETQAYDDKGRITQNNLGTYNYAIPNKPYQNSSISLVPNAVPYYTGRPTLNITYNTFKSPVQIEETGVDKVSFTYNDYNSRSVMFYGGLQDDKLLRQYRKHYSADGTMEIKENRSTGAIEFITYIGGNAYNSSIVLKSDGTTQNFLYLQRDYQGSVVAISDADGSVLEKRIFDAWGNIAKVQNGAGIALQGLTILDIGYTGHEHIQSVGIINMNGRIYDPKLRRFLQPDNNIQSPLDIQNYNRYGYVLNNPLKYTDPSGESFKEWWSKNWKTVVTVVAAVATVVIITVSMGSATPLVVAMWAGAGGGLVGSAVGSALNGDNLGQIAMKGLKGAIFGAISGYLGGAAALYSPVSGAFSGAVYGGTTNVAIGGFVNFMQGNDIGDGFAMNLGIGLLTGGYVGYKTAQAQGLNVMTGAPKSSVIADNVNSSIDDAQLSYQKSLTTQEQPIDMSNTATADLNYSITEQLDEVIVHGNSLNSPKPTWGYKLFDKDGNFLKNGITNKLLPEKRYTKDFMSDKFMESVLFPNRLEAYHWEYQQNLINKGPLNLNMH